MNIDIHRVKTIVMSSIRDLGDSASRDITITDENGHEVCITLYSRSEDEDALKVLA
jgi:hypothetical protein